MILELSVEIQEKITFFKKYNYYFLFLILLNDLICILFIYFNNFSHKETDLPLKRGFSRGIGKWKCEEWEKNDKKINNVAVYNTKRRKFKEILFLILDLFFKMITNEFFFLNQIPNKLNYHHIFFSFQFLFIYLLWSLW